jgi:hypothetical protein
VTLHLPVDEQAVRRAVDVSVLDVHPRAVNETMEILDGRGFFGRRHGNSAERD